MSKKFGQLWKEWRTANARLTLREVSEQLGLSVGYLSDIEQGRRGAPDLETVRRYEKIVGNKDRSLLVLAQSLRGKISADLIEPLKTRPILADLLLRCEEYSDQELRELIDNLGQKKAE